jgi:hypothetical protein
LFEAVWGQGSTRPAFGGRSAFCRHATPRNRLSAPDTGLVRSPVQQKLALSLLLILATLRLYNQVRDHPFVDYDDDRYVIDNVHVTNGLSWEGTKWAFTSYDESNWHTSTWLSHMLDCELFHLNRQGHQDSNLLLHVLNVVALFWVLQEVTGCRGRSLMVATPFASHPPVEAKTDSTIGESSPPTSKYRR